MTTSPTQPPSMTAAIYVDNGGAKPALTLDVEHFDRILNRPDIPQTARHEALNDLWQLIAMFIDIGWGVHERPVSNNNSEQPRVREDKKGLLRGDMVGLEMQSLMEDFIESSKLNKDMKGAPHERL